jgi:hypothetical protein
MASKSTLSTENLEQLGTARLAELLMEISHDNAATQRFLRLALAEAANPEENGPLVRKKVAIAFTFTDLGRQHEAGLDQ